MRVPSPLRRLRWQVPALLLTALACALAAPASALAVEYTVDSTLDEGDDSIGAGGCHTAGNKCTLRAAIEESNFSTGVKDTIKFKSPDFNGELADTIALGAGFPIVTDPVTIDGDGGSQCLTAAGVNGPCVGVSGPSGNFGIRVEDDGVTIEGLAVTGALIGINVINGSDAFTARGNWLGVKLDGSNGANNTGLFLDPNSNDAVIGGSGAAARNVFAFNNNEGLDIEGASRAVVRGNYFGVQPDGVTQAGNGKNLELTDSTAGGGFKAEENEIGGGVSPAQAATTACDGGCNVISGSLSTGIDMSGTGGNEAPASGPTTIQSNFVGFNAAGSAVVQNATTGILVGGNGITSEEDEVAIVENLISMQGGVAIEQHAFGALIAGNEIGRGGSEPLSGGATGIRLYGDNSLLGNAIIFNLIENTTGNGVLIENDSNLVIFNLIAGAGAAGVRIQSFGGVLPSTGNVIGGEEEGEENGIFENGGDAIEVAGVEDDRTQIGLNVGAANAGLFIDLGADGAGNSAGGPNDGIQAPTISKATVSGASGAGARPGATVRVFRKTTASPGEIASFLGEATASGSGKWSLSYGAEIPAGTRIAATQSEAEGTFELSAIATTAPKPTKAPPSPPGDVTAPQTTIKKGPKKRTRSRKAKFKFVSSEAGSTFECKLDRKPFRPCHSPKKYKGLKPGKHVFKVRATDAAGNRDKSAAKRKFRVLPPQK